MIKMVEFEFSDTDVYRIKLEPREPIMVLDSEFTHVEPGYVGCDCYPWPGQCPYCGAN